VGQTIRHLLERAVKAGASDVHLEPRGGYGVVRVRVSGTLQTITKLPASGFADVTSEFKRLGGLDTANRQAPQLGRWNWSTGRQSYEIQIASVPAIDGERLTLHFVDSAAAPPTLGQLGYWGSTLTTINRALTQPYGLIVVAGPDRASTLLTLTGIASSLSNPVHQVAMIEHAATYQLPGVRQLVVRPEIGLTAARQVRAALRGRANVVVVDDVSDRVTMQAAMQAAEQQLVIIGAHGQDAAEALFGLAHLSKEPALLAQNLVGAVGQQLVQRLCPECREAYVPDHELQKQLLRSFDISAVHVLELAALSQGLGTHPEQFSANRPSSTEQRMLHLWRSTPGGCKACSHIGYFGHTIIGEALPVNSKLQAMLGRVFTPADIRKLAGNDTIPLAQDAAVKALRGIIPIESALALIKT
jgi:type II secretory ATPase GspE/PulE/Tfp pilus assembly ATPase PilB-like protein